MIRLEHLMKNYTTSAGVVTALEDINLTVNAGEIYGIIGKSGAGKSTLIRCVNLLEKPTSGRVIVDQQDLTTLSTPALRQARHRIGIIFQHFNLLNSRTVYDNIALPLKLLKKSKKEIAKTLTPLLTITGLQDKQHDYPSQLSGGQKQRVAIARALASRPTILLSDEATSSLDPETTLSILQLLKNIRDQFNLTILLITHEMSVIKQVCDRVGILAGGKLIEENEVGEFFAKPKTAIAQQFIASSLPLNLPSNLEKRLLQSAGPNTNMVLRLWFQGEAATQPIMANLIETYHLKINILQANVESIKQHAMGIMIIAIEGDAQQLQNALSYLEKSHVKTEVMGYVPRDHITFN